ncbi:hypothetical protein EYF80_028612 [Liparis tanakae]|uniref:Uncharacterized protein n=1 Tax=Liparis tanakae TaxID=230148 RepID=A0A4Z2H8C1_9TELE|nr:hypothetical protein EYF80_028612 [Liparis tanakae]
MQSQRTESPVSRGHNTWRPHLAPVGFCKEEEEEEEEEEEGYGGQIPFCSTGTGLGAELVLQGSP